MMRAGVSEDGVWSKTEVGTPQGAVISPLLANIYLHYVFDLWAHRWRRHHASGDMIIFRTRTTSCWDSSITAMPSGS